MYAKDQLVRKLHYRRIEKVNGVWSALEMEMFDVRRKGRTVLKSDKLQYNVALKDELFTLQSLRRGE
jgi:hypothetical protein